MEVKSDLNLKSVFILDILGGIEKVKLSGWGGIFP